MSEISHKQVLPYIEKRLKTAEKYILPSGQVVEPLSSFPEGGIKVGVDLGTAYLVMVVLDENDELIAGEYEYARVVRDGLVVDYIGAVDIISSMRNRLEKRIGRKINYAASAFPPGVALPEIRANANVIEAAGMICTGLIDEPSAANLVLQVENGAIVDIGGGTTGLAVVKNGEVIYTADDPTGGTHFSLVISGALDIDFEEAEKLKKNPVEQARLFPLVRPVMEKVAVIINRHISGMDIDRLFLVGGTSCFPGMDKVIEEYTGIQVYIPSRPLFVTPIGIAMAQLNEDE